MHLGFAETVVADVRIYEDEFGAIVVLSGDPTDINPALAEASLLETLLNAGIPREAILAALDQL